MLNHPWHEVKIDSAESTLHVLQVLQQSSDKPPTCMALQAHTIPNMYRPASVGDNSRGGPGFHASPNKYRNYDSTKHSQPKNTQCCSLLPAKNIVALACAFWNTEHTSEVKRDIMSFGEDFVGPWNSSEVRSITALTANSEPNCNHQVISLAYITCVFQHRLCESEAASTFLKWQRYWLDFNPEICATRKERAFLA